MPEPNLRIVCVGAPRADKQFELFVVDRVDANKSAAELARLAERAEHDVQRLLREAERATRRAAPRRRRGRA